MIDQAITELVQYGLDTGLVAPEDKIFVTNQILEALGLESYEETPGSRGAEELEQILKEITDYAVDETVMDASLRGSSIPRKRIFCPVGLYVSSMGEVVGFQ